MSDLIEDRPDYGDVQEFAHKLARLEVEILDTAYAISRGKWGNDYFWGTVRARKNDLLEIAAEMTQYMEQSKDPQDTI